MASDWYFLINDREYGPLDGNKLRRLARSGQLTESTPVRKGADGKWVEATLVRGLFSDSGSGKSGPPPLSESHPAAPVSSKRDALKRRAPVLMTVGAFAGVVALAFYVGRQSAVSAIPDSTTQQIASQPTAPGKDAKSLPIAKADLQPGSESVITATAAGKETAAANLAKQLTPGEQPLLPSERDPGHVPAVRHVIADAEKSVAFIEVDGYASENDGVGSGFLIGRNMLVTNYHVIEGGKTIRVTFPDGRKVDALGWLAVDQNKDLALLGCDSGDLQPLNLATSRPNKLDVVFAVGSPLGLSGTISNGIVSGIRSDQELGKDVVLIQSTAAISPGNSGGPLLNEKGEVLGVTSMFLKGGQNLNFSVAAEHVAELITNNVPQGPQPWYKLPLPPLRTVSETTIREDQKQLSPNEQVRIAAERFGEAIRANKKARTDAEEFAALVKDAQKEISLSKSTEAELNRIGLRATAIVHELSQIEAAVKEATNRRNNTMQDLADTVSRGGQVEQEFEQVQQLRRETERQLKEATRNAPLVRQRNDLLARVTALGRTHSQLLERAESLRQQVGDIDDRIRLNAGERDQLIREVDTLRQQYNKTRGQ